MSDGGKNKASKDGPVSNILGAVGKMGAEGANKVLGTVCAAGKMGAEGANRVVDTVGAVGKMGAEGVTKVVDTVGAVGKMGADGVTKVVDTVGAAGAEGTAGRVCDVLYSTVDAMGVLAAGAARTAASPARIAFGFGPIPTAGSGVAAGLDSAFKERIEAARRGGAGRMRVVRAAGPVLLEDGGGGGGEYRCPFHAKSEEETRFIYDALGDALLFRRLGEREMSALVGAFERHTVPGGTEIIRQGDVGDYFYVIAGGTVAFVVDGANVGSGGRGDSFGELALLYDSPRAATCVAGEGCELWRVDRGTFGRVVATYSIEDDNETKRLLKKVDFLKGLDDPALTKVAYLMITKEFRAGETVLERGEKVDHFCLVKEGRLKATGIEVGKQKYDDIEVGPGEYFGEGAMLKDIEQVARVVATEKTEAICIERDDFKALCGDYKHLMRKGVDKRFLAAVPFKNKPKLHAGVVDAMADLIINLSVKKNHVFYTEGMKVSPALYSVRSGKVSISSKSGATKVIGEGGYFGEEMLDGLSLQTAVVAEHTAKVVEDSVVGVLMGRAAASVIGGQGRRSGIRFDELVRHRILGAGTFGRVWLVSKRGTEEAYALKVQFKRQLIDEKQAEGVVHERDIMSKLDSDFIIKLISTYQDKENVYMLTKLYQGGELRHVMDNVAVDTLPEWVAKFYAASVLEGLNYMHRRHIIYRDLKPENVMLDSGGYTVIIDLGFAKFVPEKTYSFCGTPLYLAPEIILQRGHNKGADHWSWGALVYEMVCGITPFYDRGISEMVLYKRIVNARYTLPAGGFMSEECKDLIQRMLVVAPTNRLGFFSGGGKDIQSHPWFEDVSFEELAEKKMTPPWKPEVKDPLDVSNFDNWDHLAEKKQVGHPLTLKEQKVFKDF